MKVKRYSICLALASLLICGGTLIGGCDCPAHNSVGPSPENASRQYGLTDGIRTNGTESDDLHPPVETWEAWYGGQKIAGPTPEGNFWTEAAATLAYDQVRNGAK
jgi:hypothetical protein